MICRRAWQRLGPLARRTVTPSSRNAAPVRQMSFGIPGGSTNLAYFILCGGGLTAAVVYAYKTVNGDSERYNDRLADMGSKPAAAEEDLTAGKILAGSTVEIAAASVGETSIVNAVWKLEDEKAPEASEPVVEVLEPLAEIPKAVVEELPEESAVEEVVVGEAVPAEAGEEEPMSEEAPALAVDAPTVEVAAEVTSDTQEEEEASPAEQVVTEEAPASAAVDEEEAAASPSDEGADPVPAVEDVGEDTVEPEASSPEAVSEEAALIEEAAPSEEASPIEEGATEEAAPVEEAAPAEEAPEAEAKVEEAAVEAPAEPVSEEAAGSDPEVLSATEAESASEEPEKEGTHCHSAVPASEAAEMSVVGEELAPPTALEKEVQLEMEGAGEGAMDLAEDANEDVSPVEGQTTERMAVVTAQS